MSEHQTSLSPAELSDAGLSGFAFGYRDKVRFYELDALNHVNNVVFLKWFETIRVSYVQAYGLTDYSATDDDPQLVVRHLSADYLAPMYQNQSYIVATRARLIKPTSFIMDYAVAVEGEIKSKGDCVVISLEQDGKTRRAHDPDAVQRMITRDGAELVR